MPGRKARIVDTKNQEKSCKTCDTGCDDCGCREDRVCQFWQPSSLSKVDGFIRQEKCQVGYPEYDIVESHFKKYREQHNIHEALVEIKQHEYSDDKIHMLIFENRMVAFVIERRDDFNDIEYTFGEIKDGSL